MLQFHSEYRSTYTWHEYAGPKQEHAVVQRPPHQAQPSKLTVSLSLYNQFSLLFAQSSFRSHFYVLHSIHFLPCFLSKPLFLYSIHEIRPLATKHVSPITLNYVSPENFVIDVGISKDTSCLFGLFFLDRYVIRNGTQRREMISNVLSQSLCVEVLYRSICLCGWHSLNPFVLYFLIYS